MLPNRRELIIKTPKHKLKIECYFNFISVDKVEVKKRLFLNLCKIGCKNFNQKYCCPPCSPDFEYYIKACGTLLVLLFKINLNQLSSFNYRENLKLKIGNAVIKPRIEKVMSSLESLYGSKFLGTGACRLCKPCQKKIGKPCRYPKRMRFSLESLGVDCDKLSKDLFGIQLQWYKNRKAPGYTSVICALPLKRDTKKEELGKLLEIEINKLSDS